MTELTEAGERLVQELRATCFRVEAAFWANESESGEWFLYVVSSEVENAGRGAAFRKVNDVLRGMPSSWIVQPDVKLIGARDPIAQHVLDVYQKHPGATAMRYGGRQLGGMLIDDAYLYPPSAV